MSLIISNRATDKQLQALKNAGYTDTTNLSVSEAAELLDELYTQKKHDESAQYIEFEGDYIEIF